MTRVAAIDCGTNSLRLLIAEVNPNRLTELHRQMEIVRLGQGVDKTGRLSPAALQRTQLVLVEYSNHIRDFGATQIRMVATSALRDAENQDEFRQMVVEIFGVEPEIITGDEEASLSFAGAGRGLSTMESPCLVADIGGGSTELVLGELSQLDVSSGQSSPLVTSAFSMDIGCVRLTERHFHNDPPTNKEIAAAETDVIQALDQAQQAMHFDQVPTFIGLAGSVTTVAAIALGLTHYDREQVHHSVLSAEQVTNIAQQLAGMNHEQRAALSVIHPGRVDVITAGALVLKVIMRELNATSILVSEFDILDGIAWSIAR